MATSNTPVENVSTSADKAKLAAAGLLLVGGVAVLWLVLRRRSRLAPDAFEPDLPDDADAADDTRSGPTPAKPAR